jgi:hypothetical protein
MKDELSLRQADSWLLTILHCKIDDDDDLLIWSGIMRPVNVRGETWLSVKGIAGAGGNIGLCLCAGTLMSPDSAVIICSVVVE